MIKPPAELARMDTPTPVLVSDSLLKNVRAFPALPVVRTNPASPLLLDRQLLNKYPTESKSNPSSPALLAHRFLKVCRATVTRNASPAALARLFRGRLAPVGSSPRVVL